MTQMIPPAESGGKSVATAIAHAIRVRAGSSFIALLPRHVRKQ